MACKIASKMLKGCICRGTGAGLGTLPIPGTWQMGLVTNV